MSGINIDQLLALAGFVNGIFSIGLGLFVLGTDWKKRVNQLFFAFTFCIAVWALSYAGWLSLDSNPYAANAAMELLWSRWLDFGALWIPITFAHWLTTSLSFDMKKYPAIKYFLMVGYLLTICISFFAWTPLFISGVAPEMFFVFAPRAGALYGVYIALLYVAFALIYCPFILYLKVRELRKESPSEVNGLIVFGIGLMAGFVGGSTNFPLLYGVLLPPYGTFLVSFWVFLTGYVTIRYNTLHLRKVVATELLVAAIWLFLLSRMFLTILSSSIFGAIPDMIVLLGSIFIGFFLIRSVLNEVKQKEQLETVNSQLDKSNADLEQLSKSLQQKVDEQTKDVRKAYEVEHKARIELEQLDKNKDQFILATQHHLRTPLTIIKGYMQSLLVTPPQEFKPETKTILQSLDTSADNLSALVNKLLDVSEMEVRGKEQKSA